MAVVDWNGIATDPGISALAAVLREEHDVWVGFVDEDGVAIPAAVDHEGRRKPVCRAIMANPVEDAAGETTSCSGSLDEWSGRVGETERSGEWVRCHAGFRAHLLPVERDDEVLGGVYASGFLGEDDEDVRAQIGDLVESNGLDAQLDADAVEEVPAFDDRERARAATLLRRIRDRAESLVQEREATELGGEDAVRFEGMLGGTRRMRSLFDQVATVAETDSTVLVQGENGTGKELVARALHRRSARSDERFVAVNCAAIPDRLVESELFGHKKGSFSGAHRDREGLCAEADGGTLLLDEIGEMASSLQSKLLRFLQDGEFTPVGSNKARRVDVRVICATNQDLQSMVEAGEFRRDLYFRIHVVQIVVPPLRDRRDDIGLLADHFLERAAREHGREAPELTEACRRRLLTYDWPGNVRELENEVERLVIMAGDDEEVGVENLSPRLGGEENEEAEAFPVPGEMTLPEATEQLERRMILDELRATGWNKTQTAENLDVSRRNLIRKVSDYELEEYREE